MLDQSQVVISGRVDIHLHINDDLRQNLDHITSTLTMHDTKNSRVLEEHGKPITLLLQIDPWVLQKRH